MCSTLFYFNQKRLLLTARNRGHQNERILMYRIFCHAQKVAITADTQSFKLCLFERNIGANRAEMPQFY